MKVGLIGFARQGLSYRSDYYDYLVATVLKTIPNDSHVVSGGSIWCDHIAVTLFLNGNVKELTLHLPDKWSFEKREFMGTTSSGRTLNTIHKQFSKILGRNTLHEIDQVLNSGAVYTSSSHFFERNTLIAQSSDVLYAIVVKNMRMTPGTRDTWTKSSGPKFIIEADQPRIS